MQDQELLLSICIPTNGAVNWVIPVIDSIYEQGVDNSLFEVVITDNGKESQLADYISTYNHCNLRYIPTTEDGFLNLIAALKEGKGQLCKMLNHRSVLIPGIIEEWLNVVRNYIHSKPIIYFSDGMIKGGDLIVCNDIDEFLNHLSYWSSWSAGISIWRDDIPQIENMTFDKMFPNSSLLFGIREHPHYVIWNKKYQEMEDDAGKGGYNFFHTFSVDFLDLINQLRIVGKIRENTCVKIRKELYGFLTYCYMRDVILPSQHTFLNVGIRSSMDVYYGRYYYWKMVVLAWLKAPKAFVQQQKSRIRKRRK